MFDRKKSSSGFTIVELLIVIVVIAILAAISIVSYTGIQARAMDTQMRSGVDAIEKAIYLWYTEKGQAPKAGWSSTTPVANENCSDGTGGWVASGTYVCTLEDVLVSSGNLPSGFVRKLPSNSGYSNHSDGIFSLMFYPCSSGSYALYWHLRTPTEQDTQSLAAAEAQGCPTSPRTIYAMKAAKTIRL